VVAGSRLLRGVVIPGGVSPLLADPSRLAGELYRLLGDFEEIVAIALDNTLVRDRREGIGCLAAEVARDYGTVGVVARASGVADRCAARAGLPRHERRPRPGGPPARAEPPDHPGIWLSDSKACMIVRQGIP
jgi:Ni,Fe-hydrogenase III large subunit